MGLIYGPPTRATIHLCIDMQRLFTPDGIWPVPWMANALPHIQAIAERVPAQSIFTRFIPPEKPEQMPGTWQAYYRAWREVTQQHIHPELLELVPPLAALCPPAQVIDKGAYSAFSTPALLQELRARHADGLVITGGETDVCVLATVLSAVDLGYRVILPTDAVCSSSDEHHDNLVELYEKRFTHQIETIETEALLSCWQT
jgi:nicotinamidase-related amidase